LLYDRAVPRLPFAPRPFPDELLLSWICRLAAANHVSLNDLFPTLAAMNRCQLNCDPGDEIITRLAAMARLPQSTLHGLLLPYQFSNLCSLTFLRTSHPSDVANNGERSESFPLPFCRDCAGEGERQLRSLYWQAEAGLLTSILCPRHGTFYDRSCPGCGRLQLTLAWQQTHLIVRCLRCGWEPVPAFNIEKPSVCPLGPRQLLFRLQHDIVATLRGQPPSTFWCEPIPAIQFLWILDDLYWLLRTPELSAICGEKFTFCDAFSWTRYGRNSRFLFTRTQCLPFSAWDSESRAELPLAMAATILGTRAFETLRSKPCYPPPSACYPWDWILPSLDEDKAQELLRRVSKWPISLRFPVSIIARRMAQPDFQASFSTSKRPHSTSYWDQFY
jgi:hypothetical protein